MTTYCHLKYLQYMNTVHMFRTCICTVHATADYIYFHVSIYQLSVKQHMVYDALSMLHSRHLTTLAVTAEDGRLIGSVSLSDFLEIFRTKQHRMLSATVQAFITHMQSRTRHEGDPSVHPHTRASYAIEKMLSAPQRAVWIIDSKQHPVGVLYPLDVIVAIS